MLVDNPIILKDFYKHFNSRLTSFDFVFKAYNIRPDYNIYEEKLIILPVNNAQIFSQLVKHNYPDLISKILSNIQIEVSCKDIFSSEMDIELINFYTEFITDQKHKFRIKSDSNTNSFFIFSSDLMLDLIWSAISQFHSEIVASAESFNELLSIEGVTSKSFFLNANASTAFSYFIQIWVAESVGITQKPSYYN